MSNEEESLLALLCESLGNGQRGNAPIFINFNSFNGPVGQHNENADTVNFSMDKDGGISFQHIRRTGKGIIQPEVMAKALLYFPDSDPHVAMNRLNSWIKRCPPLVEALSGCYQSRFAKFFSPQAVRLIVEFLGEP